jgi:predicted phage tail protein
MLVMRPNSSDAGAGVVTIVVAGAAATTGGTVFTTTGLDTHAESSAASAVKDAIVARRVVRMGISLALGFVWPSLTWPAL